MTAIGAGGLLRHLLDQHPLPPGRVVGLTSQVKDDGSVLHRLHFRCWGVGADTPRTELIAGHPRGLLPPPQRDAVGAETTNERTPHL